MSAEVITINKDFVQWYADIRKINLVKSLRHLSWYQQNNQKGLHAFYECYRKNIDVPNNFFYENPQCTKCHIVIDRVLSNEELEDYSNDAELLCNECTQFRLRKNMPFEYKNVRPVPVVVQVLPQPDVELREQHNQYSLPLNDDGTHPYIEHNWSKLGISKEEIMDFLEKQ